MIGIEGKNRPRGREEPAWKPRLAGARGTQVLGVHVHSGPKEGHFLSWAVVGLPMAWVPYPEDWNLL